MKLRACIATVLVIWAAIALNGQQAPTQPTQSPTFKVQVDYVEVDVLVSDQRGNLVRDLKKEDFQIFEDGKPQTVTNFSLVDIPIERADRPLFASQPIEPDVRTNERPFDGRVYVVVLDEAHTDPLNTALVRRAARKFIEEHLGANDLMAVVFGRGAAGGKDEDAQEFTSNRRLLIAAVDKFTGKKPRSSTLERLDQFNNTAAIRAAGGSTGIRDPFSHEREYNARSVLEELTAVSDWFTSVRGRRKTILYFSQGMEYDIHDVFNNQGASLLQYRMQDLIRSATKSNVTIYAIDPRGLQALSDGNIELTSPADSGDLNERGLQNENRLARESLQTFAEETGGFAVVNTNGFANAFDRIVQENSSYYVLAYYPPNPKRDGKFHKIEVRVTLPGLTVRARRGYANPSGKPPAPVKSELSPELLDALNSPLPVSGLTMKVFAAPFKGVAPNASVLLGAELRGRDLSTAANSKVEFSFFAMDAKGKLKASTHGTVTLNLKPETKARVEQTGIRVLKRLDLPAGRYEVRVAAHDPTGGSTGSVSYDLEVPDFYQAPLMMSGLVLTSPRASAIVTLEPDADLRQLLPGAPAAARSFLQSEEIALFVDVYDNETTPHKVDITTTIRSDDGRVVVKSDEERSSADLGGKRGGYGYAARIPLKDLSPGPYVLKVEARSRLGSGATASREVRLTVEPPRSAAAQDGPQNLR